MLKQFVFALIFMAFAGVQFGHGLVCYTCTSPQDCTYPRTEVCNDYWANQTSITLATYHSNVPIIKTSSHYVCANVTYYSGANVRNVIEVLGCAHPGANVCYLSLRDPYVGLGKKCTTCNTNYCNSAGSLGSTSLYIMLGTLVALLLKKVLQ